MGKKFLIVGPGAMGCLFAARLKLAGFDVAVLDYKQSRANTLNTSGIFVKGVTGEYSVKMPGIIPGKLPFEPDFALFCVKSYKTEDAALALKPFLPQVSSIVTLQNGLGNFEILEKTFGKGRVCGGVTAEGATLLETGKIRHAGQGDTIVGPTGAGSPVPELVEALNKAGFNARSEQNVQGLIWGKLIINVGINALTAITGLKNGRLPEIKGTRSLLESAVKEAVKVAEAGNIELPYQDPIGRVIEVCKATSGNIASMLQDVLNKRITEIDFINGAIVREGKALNIPTPVNETLTAIVKTIQGTYDERILPGS